MRTKWWWTSLNTFERYESCIVTSAMPIMGNWWQCQCVSQAVQHFLNVFNYAGKYFRLFQIAWHIISDIYYSQIMNPSDVVISWLFLSSHHLVDIYVLSYSMPTSEDKSVHNCPTQPNDLSHGDDAHLRNYFLEDKKWFSCVRNDIWCQRRLRQKMFVIFIPTFLPA